ncbi:hypothetical protein HanXRQr2_Chr17g0807061 [Helianthus annuus]|uniref:Uncharacterized protein n=1 Tax=Helianthus annuus TaxID=4232 RepID=A0A251RSW8_HELAN|nr:hypothetical protein HanXRQr2_Chr17g0807061 [Helianthus annuus]KAJ0636459.1 hypothetical protein HanOQP8_Chr17g0662131 [Helianthus annuus]
MHSSTQWFTTWLMIVERLESFLASHGFRYNRCCKSGCPLSILMPNKSHLHVPFVI